MPAAIGTSPSCNAGAKEATSTTTAPEALQQARAGAKEEATTTRPFFLIQPSKGKPLKRGSA